MIVICDPKINSSDVANFRNIVPRGLVNVEGIANNLCCEHLSRFQIFESWLDARSRRFRISFRAKAIGKDRFHLWILRLDRFC